MRERIGRFRRILKAREMARDLIQKQMADLRAQENALIDKLKKLRDEKQLYMDRFSQVAQGQVTIDELRISSEDISRTEDHIKEGIVEIFHLRKRIDQVEAILVERHKDVRKVEMYLEQMILQWEKEMNRRDQIVVDDMAGILHDRKNREGGNLQ
ncbi:flagellar export protein FliJ [Dethiosulfovibrio salsuginis]|uniref:Flagellar FliJ protein n=1 Tax=Dethiosulfovibrio salsuginis TaxID=561720 RepID=A0A1X7K9B1_9BACT|nr:flagellar FliJ family protein [Dethiosulfovibrio salsuginis]SMG37704.1 flagellar export protein FliJ [Dethiosulfovibrio salsuginis]